ncbi:interleukin-6 receptor subunit beta isoform X1 [Mastacembelus armatus]|uniref:interleukin-6 receptor subunit beta isoform X1 n=1 Tax=Mastacembelus armatus TaxID=205130 RepID=UPI000E455487|nr:interleukin-6 receptor subunit beta isoform X1 [Mastacembelus armatus]
MVSARLLQLLVLARLLSALPARGENDSHLVIAPQSPLLEIGTNFTATCLIINTDKITADDLYWKLHDTTVPKEQYIKVNSSALNVTVLITNERAEWLFCSCNKEKNHYVFLNSGKFIHGIFLRKGYRPEKPENLSCLSVQEKFYISPVLSCKWDSVGRQTPDIPTTYTLFVRVIPSENFSMSTDENHTEVRLNVFPNHMTMEVWVEARNKLGTAESEHLKVDAGWFVKTNPPSDVRVISEPSFPAALLINWTQPIEKYYLRLTYQIRYCPEGSQSWTYVPPEDIAKDIESFRLQDLQPDTVYVIQVRCKNAVEGHGHWSNWSANTTKRTPEFRPKSKPDLWRVIAEGDSINERRVQIICKDPVLANGRILKFDIKIQDVKHKVKNVSWEWESILVNRTEANSSSNQRKITPLKEILLANTKSVKVHVTASNSVGKSAEASLVISEKARVPPPVEELKVWPKEGQLWLKWNPPTSMNVTEYVVEWVTGDQIDWQKENRNTLKTAIKGNLETFVCYTISVYPIYYGRIGKPTTEKAYLEQGAPIEGPIVRLRGKPGRNEAELVWTEIPQQSQRGFITNYTISYTSGTKLHNITVPVNTTSYTLRSLSGNTKYDIWINASTIQGSTKGFNHSFTTLKYAPGEIELIVVGVSLGFLFVVVMTMLLCIYKKDVITKNFWPQIPNPGESTIGSWSPDYSLKTDTPKENCLSGISVLDVDVCDGKCVFEEDKASLPLKKDKYLSEEHSSGIGGSSCMSSPRQSVSDSDEGGDMADTTASTIQYSSVVASNGYKGQTPSSQPQQGIFSRSESTQPLLDSEENPDMIVHEGSGHFQRFSRRPCFTRTAEGEDDSNPADISQLEMHQQEMLEHLDFCPLEENPEQTTPTDEHSADWLPSAPVSSYMPQLGGYRSQ